MDNHPLKNIHNIHNIYFLKPVITVFKIPFLSELMRQIKAKRASNHVSCPFLTKLAQAFLIILVSVQLIDVSKLKLQETCPITVIHI